MVADRKWRNKYGCIFCRILCARDRSRRNAVPSEGIEVGITCPLNVEAEWHCLAQAKEKHEKPTYSPQTKNPAHIERGFVLKVVYNYSALSAAASPASPFFAAAFLPARRRVAFGFAALAPFLLPV